MPDVLCLSETWLNSGDDAKSLLVTGYHQYALTSRRSKGGGIMIQLKSVYDLIRIPKNPLSEAVIEISANSLRFFVVVIYNKPSRPKIDFLKIFDDFLESWSSNTKPFIICGDFNINIFEQNHYVNDYMNIIASNGFVLGVNEPTRVTHSTSTRLDHFIYRNVPNCETEVLLHQSFSDHYPIQLSWRARTKTNRLVTF